MAKIHKLSSNLSNQIAAGEVIERPASVVKELAENSLDAGSSRIMISFADAGLKEISVQDNGSGIAASQLNLAFTRHATSKISTEHDLFNVKTLGFRGEALASIAAVSHVTVTTSEDGVGGVKATFSAGSRTSFSPAAAKKGTKIVVKDLFYNTPARLKYLRSPRTEIMRIVDIVDRLSLGYPKVSFTLIDKGKVLLKTTGNGKLRQDIASIYGRHVGENMLAVKGSNSDFDVYGLISRPEMTRSTRNFISLLLNGRYIRNLRLSKAILAGYGNHLSPRHYPIAVLSIRVDPLLVDVNVHPTKREVRLSKEDQLARLITNIISSKLQTGTATSDALVNLDGINKPNLLDQLKFNLNPRLADTSRRREKYVSEAVAERNNPYVSAGKEKQDRHYVFTKTWERNVLLQERLPAFPDSSSGKTLTSQAQETIEKHLPNLHLIGIFHSIILAASAKDLFLVNSVAARRRLEYDILLRDIKSENQTEQELLTPIVLDFDHIDFLKLRRGRDDLARIGIQLEEFGKDSFIMRSYPNWIKKETSVNVRKVLNLYLNNDEKDTDSLPVAAALELSSHQHFSGLTRLSASKILQRLTLSVDPYRDANGNLILVRLSQTDLNKMFGKGE